MRYIYDAGASKCEPRLASGQNLGGEMGSNYRDLVLSLFRAFAGYHVPLFIDEEFAKHTRFGGRIVPGSMTMTIAAGMTEARRPSGGTAE